MPLPTHTLRIPSNPTPTTIYPPYLNTYHTYINTHTLPNLYTHTHTHTHKKLGRARGGRTLRGGGQAGGVQHPPRVAALGPDAGTWIKEQWGGGVVLLGV